ncbi:MAG TPA: serine esterase [Pedococcus sp.]|nr:serine esterase [Pedococcus sp.]
MTTALPEPVVLTAGNADPVAPLVVLLHGRGSNERDIIELAGHLPPSAAYVAVRAPITEGPGFAWFAKRGIGRPTPESLRRNIDWFTAWLDTYAPGREVILVGFSGGAAFAGGLLLDQPARYSAAAILYGTLPFDAGVPITPGRLAGIPVFIAQGDQDSVIPRDLLDATWDYLTNPSGAPAWATHYPGGHGITTGALSDLAGWLHWRLTYLAEHGPGSGLDARGRAFPAVCCPNGTAHVRR